MIVYPPMTFDEWVKLSWPTRVPRDCTRLDRREQDCLERVDDKPCGSCVTYARLADEYYGNEILQNRA